MRFFKAIFVSALAAVAAAQSTSDLIAQIPACAKTCLENGAKAVGCATSDAKCQCEKLVKLTSDIQSCITSGCSIDDATKTVGLLSKICLNVAGQVGGDTFSSLVTKASSAATAGLADATRLATSAADALTKAPTPTGANGAPATPAPGAAGRNLAGVGFAAAVMALAL